MAAFLYATTIVSDFVVVSFASVLFAVLRAQVPDKSGTGVVCARAWNITPRTSEIVIRS
jgi:hypothetical protein